MRPYDRNQLLVSVHVPKCAGTSFGEILKAWFGGKFHPHYPDMTEPGPPPRATLKVDACVHGHFYHHAYAIGVHDYYPDSVQMITVLRDPLDMMISTYFYLRRLGTARHECLRDYLDEFLGWGELLNYRNFPFDVRSADAVEIVEERFVWVGLTDRLAEGVPRLARQLERCPPRDLPVLNMASRDQAVPEGYETKFRRTFHGEYRFYDTLRRRIERDLDR